MIFFIFSALPVTLFFLNQQTNYQEHAAGVNDLFVSTTGSDSNPCTQTAPCATITHAATLTTPGTTVHVFPGIYTKSITTTMSGIATARITYISDNKWGAQIKTVGSNMSFFNKGDYVDIVGFDITGDGSYGIDNYGSNVRIMNNRVHDIPAAGCTSNGGAGIDNENYTSHDSDITGNVVFNIGLGNCQRVQGIYQAIKGGHIYNNISYQNSGFGIHLWHAASNVIISNNLLFENKTGGIIVGAGDAPGGVTDDYTTVSNNIVMHNHGSPAIYEYGQTGTHNQYFNNFLYVNDNNTITLQNGLIAQGTLYLDPQLVSYQPNGSGDYHLKSISPAIDTGTSIGAPSIDFDGNTRPQGKGYDIGAYEYVFNTVTSIPTNIPSSKPTLTQQMGTNKFALTVCPHGLGNCGDNANPTAGGNTNPLHPQRNATITVFNSMNQQVAQGQGIITYNPSAKNFQGTMSITNLAVGNYLMAIHVDGFLAKQIPGIITVSSTSQTITLPGISLVTGDINNDNQLDILDYNLLVSCFGSKANTSSCQTKAASDLNDDGSINGIDYNLFLRELSVQHGG